MTSGVKQKSPMEDLRLSLRAILVPAVSTGLSLSDIQRDYEMFKCKDIPFRDFGFHTLEDLLRSLSDVIVCRNVGGGGLRYFPVSDASTKHIEKLVREQKPSGPAAARGGGGRVRFSLTPQQKVEKRNIVEMMAGRGRMSYTTFTNLFQSTYGRKFIPQVLFGHRASVVFSQLFNDVFESKQDRKGQIFIVLKHGVAPAPRAPRTFPARGTTPQMPWNMVAAREPPKHLPPPPLSAPAPAPAPVKPQPVPALPPKFDFSGPSRFLNQRTAAKGRGRGGFTAPRFEKEEREPLKPVPVPVPSPWDKWVTPPPVAQASPFPLFPSRPQKAAGRGQASTSTTTSFGGFPRVPLQQGIIRQLQETRTVEEVPVEEGERSGSRTSIRVKISRMAQLPLPTNTGAPSPESMKRQVWEILCDIYPEWILTDEFSALYKRFYAVDLSPENYYRKGWTNVLKNMFDPDLVKWDHGGLDGWRFCLQDKAAIAAGLKNGPQPAPKAVTEAPKAPPPPANERVGWELSSETETEEGRVRKVARMVQHQLQLNPGSSVKIWEIQSLMRREGIHKSNQDIMNIFWVRYKGHFEAATENGEIVTKLVGGSQMQSESPSGGSPDSWMQKIMAAEEQSFIAQPPRRNRSPGFKWESFPEVDQECPLEERFVQIDVAQYNSLWEIWVNVYRNVGKIEDVMRGLAAFYPTAGEQEWGVKGEELWVGMPCAALYGAVGWHRGMIKRISSDKKQKSSLAEECEVMYVDYGTVEREWTAHLRRLDEAFMGLPAQAIPVSLPVDKEAFTDPADLKIIQDRFFEAMGGNAEAEKWAFGMRRREDTGNMEVEMFLQSQDGNRIYISEFVLSGLRKRGEKNDGGAAGAQEVSDDDLIDLEWEAEVEAELQAADTGEFVPSDPETETDTGGAERLTPDAAMLRLRVLEIRRMRLATEASISPTLHNPEQLVAEMSDLDDKIKELEGHLLRMGVQDY